jgi:hypothetical protein
MKLRPVFCLAPGVFVACFYFFAGVGQAGAQTFDTQYGDFVRANREIMRRLSKLPPTRSRDQAIRAAVDNLDWAARYRSQGMDPSFFEELRYHAELDSCRSRS